MNQLLFRFALAIILFLTLWERASCFGSSSLSTVVSTRDSRSFLSVQSGPSLDEMASQPLPENVEETKIRLDTGVTAQVFSGRPTKRTKLSPLVFIHGSFHSGWCWTEHYFSYFMSLGYSVASLSLRGTGGTSAGEGVKKIKIDEHAQDLESFLSQLPDIVGTDEKPIIISHSFGGLVVMKYLERAPKNALKLGGIIIMCSVPPSGNGKMTMRFIKRSLVDSWKITTGFAMKRCIQNDLLCRELFFGGSKKTSEDGTVEDYGVSDEDIQRYQGYFKRDTEAVIDIRDLLNNLPSANAVDGKAPNLESFPRCLVVGAKRDFIVDHEGVEETARYFGVSEPTFVESPHDVMLGRDWKNAASVIHSWAQSNY
jgi:pimeloyl-ACP methyl ester carboxylesterase